MTKVIADESMRAKLKDFTGPVAVCDDSGQTLGHFLPEDLYRHLIYEWANAQITDEELQKRLQESGGRSLAEILADLQKQ